MRWLFVVVLAGGASPPPGPTWYGHVAGLKTPAGEEAVASLRERLKREDAANVRVRHAEAGDNARAAAVRLLGVNGAKGLILGPGLRDRGASAELADAVAGLVRVHEDGGWLEADLVQAADSLSFLETMVATFDSWVKSGRGSLALR